MAIVKTLAKGQIVIPADIRKRYRIEPGTEIQIMEYGYQPSSGDKELKKVQHLIEIAWV
jgi:AbrB family looped-hinge helix DNA binding protein